MDIKRLEQLIKNTLGDGYGLEKGPGYYKIQGRPHEYAFFTGTKKECAETLWAINKYQYEVEHFKTVGLQEKLEKANQELEQAQKEIARLKLLEASLQGVNARPARKL